MITPDTLPSIRAHVDEFIDWAKTVGVIHSWTVNCADDYLVCTARCREVDEAKVLTSLPAARLRAYNYPTESGMIRQHHGFSFGGSLLICVYRDAQT